MGILDGKIAVIYGGGGSLGSGVAAAFVREGAHVILHLNSGSGAGAMAGMGSTGPAETAAFLASDRAAGITASMTNVTSGLVPR